MDKSSAHFVAWAGRPCHRRSERPIVTGAARRFQASRSRRRGAIFITALWVTILLASITLVMCRSMQTEAVASSNRMTMAECDAIEKGAEQYVMCNVDGCTGDALTVTALPAEAMPVGDGYFWIIRPWPDNDTDFGYGITDEASKLNLNVATAKQLINAPNVTQEIADAIVDWRDADSTVSGSDGAESDYYNSLSAFPYNAKNGDFETVEELLLVRDVSKDVLFGIDLNRDGMISPAEQDQDPTNGGSSFGSNYNDRRGLYNFVTAYSVDPNLDATGKARTNVNSQTKVKTAMTNAGLDSGRVNTIMSRLQNTYGAAAAPTPTRGKAQATGTNAKTPAAAAASVFPTLSAFYTAAAMQPSDMAKVFDVLTAKTGTSKGLVNVNTASKQVLMTLPTLEEADADAIVAQRGSGGASVSQGQGAGWVFNAITTTSKAYAIADSITGESYVYSADIVAVSGNGRTFKRVKVVVDGRTSPAKITYRRDLTGYGWPLDPKIREQLQAGTFQPKQVTSEPAQGQPDNGLNSLQ